MDIENKKEQVIGKLKSNLLKGAVALAIATLTLNIFTVVEGGTVKVQSTLGTINPEVLTEGISLVNPISTLDTFDIRNEKYEIPNLKIPTQDRFNSTANVTVLYRISGSKAATIKKDYGTAEQYVSKTMRQFLRSIIRDEGRKVLDSRGLAQSETVSEMQFNTFTRLVEAMEGTGITIQEVLIQDIQFDPKIAKQILATQLRIQAEEGKASLERQSAIDAKIKKNEALGEGNKKREQADAEAYRLTTVALGKKKAAVTEAEGKAAAILLIASANTELSKSLTPEILAKMDKENEAILYTRSKGNVPHTIIGKTDLRAIGVPIATN